jgi:hypothetical protein
MSGTVAMMAGSKPSLPLPLCCRRGEPKSQSSTGINSDPANNPAPLNRRFEAALLPCVEMLITTSIADAPGVMGVDGLKLHCAPEGKPLAQARVTAALNEAPIG